jgi:hypothetical protein
LYKFATLITKTLQNAAFLTPASQPAAGKMLKQGRLQASVGNMAKLLSPCKAYPFGSPVIGGKNPNTEDAKYTKGAIRAILRAFFVRDLCVFCGEKDLPVKNGRALHFSFGE